MIYRIVAPRVDDFESVQIEVADPPVRRRLNRISQSQIQRELACCPDIILNERCKIPEPTGPCPSCRVLIFVYRQAQQNVGERIPAATRSEIRSVLAAERHFSLPRLKLE